MSNLQGIRRGGSALLIIALLLAGSCKTMKEKDPVDNGSEQNAVKRTLGTVRKTDDCGFYIEVLIGDLAHSYYPTNLAAKFQVDGMRLKFTWKQAKAKPPKDCPNFEPVEVSDVTAVR
jgi:hypothetical protein